MKILYLAPDPLGAPKGASVRIGQTLEALAELGHAVDVLTPEVGASKMTNYLARMIAFRAQAARWLTTRRADLVQFRSVWEGAAAVAWARRTGARAIFEAHGFPSVELVYHFPALARHGRLLDKLVDEERRVLAASDAVVVPSATTARWVRRQGVAAGHIHVIPNMVDPERFAPGAAVSAEAAPLRVVYVGTLSPWQGLTTLIEALALRRGHPPVELHVVGPMKGTWGRGLRALARSLRVQHSVVLSGPVAHADLPPVLATADVCVAPLVADARNTLQGCCPIKLLEYMAAGRPILATRLPVVEELLTHGLTAHLVRPGSAVALADGLRWMAEHPVERAALGAQARAAVLERWAPPHFRARLDDALRSVMAAR